VPCCPSPIRSPRAISACSCSARPARLVELNCAALPESLLEGELFGYERGAFTGATNAKPGLLEIADGGTVFLDEVGELPPSVQAKLLRVIEERNVMRLGSRDTRITDVRFVAATNRDLSIEVAQGRFRSDLYYRLNGITLYIPPLRERRDEVLPLAESVLSEAAARTGAPCELAPDVRAFLLRHPWPGNVRELRNVVQRAVVLADGKPIALEHLFVSSVPPRASAPLPPVESMTHARASAPIDVPVRPPPPADEEDDPERRRILAMLEQCAGNQTRAAAALGMSRTTLSARLDAYGVGRPRKRTS
jgi:transcriptional regulator with GAF, ATPase, and Fis domain